LLPPHDNARRILDSRDLLQSALKSGWIDASQFQGATEAEFYGWMRTILRRKLAQSTRRKRPIVGLADDRVAEAADERHESPLADLVDREMRERLRGAVDELTPEQREVVRLRLAGLRSPDIAARLGITPETVRMRESRASKRLRELLRPPSGEESAAPRDG